MVPATALSHEGHKHKQVKAASHGSMECRDWAARDSAHPDAPGSYSSYNCGGIGGDYVQVNGRGRYSGQLHHSLIHAVHFNCWLGIVCDTNFYTINHWHG